MAWVEPACIGQHQMLQLMRDARESCAWLMPIAVSGQLLSQASEGKKGWTTTMLIAQRRT